MKDLKQMRKEFKQRLELAKLENSINESLEPQGIEFSVIGKGENGLLTSAVTNLDEQKGDILPIELAAEVLRIFPVTDQVKVFTPSNPLQKLDYEVKVVRYANGNKPTVIYIDWISNEFQISMQTLVDENYNEVMRNFVLAQREVTNCERGMYDLAKGSMLEYYTPLCGEVWKAGYDHMCTYWAVNQLIEDIKSIQPKTNQE